MEIRNHLLFNPQGQQIPFDSTPNVSGNLKTCKFIVIHYTASRNLSGTVNWLKNPQARASCHLVIDRNGAVVQLAPFNITTWHCGQSSWNGINGLNRYSIGIELVNAGKLARHGNLWRSAFGADFPDDDVMVATHRHERVAAGWQLYPEAQLEATFQIVQSLCAHYKIKELLGHDDISPGRKIDPGPAFPMDFFRSRLDGREVSKPVVYETTTNLNIRSGPGTHFPTVIMRSLPTKTRLEVLQEEGTWRLVDVLDVVEGLNDLQGWVHSRFIRKV
jgi:N-acetylmuramoyl-L-alanine amidase